MSSPIPFEEAYGIVATALDGAFYRAVYPDVTLGAADPVRHYVDGGWREGRDPAPWFSTRAYLETHPDVAEAGWNPLCHYLTRGRREGREVVRSAEADKYLLARARQGESPRWSFEGLTAPPTSADLLAEEAAEAHRRKTAVAPAFDAAFYLTHNPDVAKSGLDPLEHFMANGWTEGRDPNADFSIRDYLDANPDVAQAGVNPFWHWLVAGRSEGRKLRVDLGFRYEVINRLQPLDKRIDALARASDRLKLGTAAALTKALRETARTGLADLHVTLSHDNYTANTGGVQLCIQREDARIAALGRDHLHVFPARPWPVVRTHGEPAALGVLLNGRSLGAYAPAAIATALRKAAAGPGGARSFAIHSLLGHNAAQTADILRAAGLSRGFFWLHDFASLCAGFHLLRNDVEDCAAPPPDSMACGICVYGPWRARHLAEHERLFERLSLTVVSPSQPTLDLWKARTECVPAAEVVLPHATLVARGPAPEPTSERPLRVAYAGMPAAHKGWEVFRALVERHGGDPRYEFHHLGGRTTGGLPLTFRKVTVTEARPRAMQEAIEAVEADVVLIWPLCRETFSFVACEAVAAGAAVITGPDSGNVAAFVGETGHGRVLADESALAALFESGEAAALSRARRKPQLYDLRFSGLTVDLLEAAR
jgi:hypothetical protein